MATYTITLRHLIERGFKFNLNDYPIFDESYREVLNKKIIDHYYFSEIGVETPGLFNHRLRTKMNEIMPYYNQIYKSNILEFNPLYNVDYHIKDERTKIDNRKQDTKNDTLRNDVNDINSNVTDNEESNTDIERNNDLTQKHVSSDTPQNLLEVNDINNNVWASEAQRNHDNTNEKTNQSLNRSLSSNLITKNNLEQNINNTGNLSENINSTDDYLRHVYGNNGGKNFSELINDYRSTFNNTDLDVIYELDPLFMLIW